MTVSERAKAMINEINELEINQATLKRTRDRLMQDVDNLIKQNKLNSEELDIAINAITILNDVSDEAVKQSYEFIQDSLNAALSKIFSRSVRKIRLVETILRGQYPQLDIELTVEGGRVRSLKTGSGHGLMQIVSLLCVLCLIVITNSRRLLVIDEVLSGLSATARKTISDILWTFTTIGFQFVVNEHGFVPEGANVYALQVDNGVSQVVSNYIEQRGVYLDGNLMDQNDLEQYNEKEEF